MLLRRHRQIVRTLAVTSALGWAVLVLANVSPVFPQLCNVSGWSLYGYTELAERLNLLGRIALACLAMPLREFSDRTVSALQLAAMAVFACAYALSWIVVAPLFGLAVVWLETGYDPLSAWPAYLPLAIAVGWHMLPARQLALNICHRRLTYLVDRPRRCAGGLATLSGPPRGWAISRDIRWGLHAGDWRMASIDPALLKTLLDTKPQLVQEAMDRMLDGTGSQAEVDSIIRWDPANPPEIAIINFIDRNNGADRFIAAVVHHGEAIAHDDSLTARLEEIRQAGADFEGLSAFALAARSFRCRIDVNGTVAGSGVLVSYRLVLTAWHVINQKGGWDAQSPPVIEVRTSDGKKWVAQPVQPFSECHPKEWDGEIPDDNELVGFDDFALLRLSQPVGFALGFAKPSCPPPTWAGNAQCFLVHYPQGQDVGLTFGKATFGGSHRRFRHNLDGLGGSSGGALFDNKATLIGVHQKRMGAHAMFVPMRNFANDNVADFIVTIESDSRPNYLWSLDQTLDSPLIIGRRLFFDALDYMVDAARPASERLRGVWMRREYANKEQSGLSFGFELLRAFLTRRQPEAKLVRIELRAMEEDLFGLVEAAIDGIEGSSIARAGVRKDETAPVAFEADRADALVGQIEARVDGPVWLYIDGPPGELTQTALYQLEQLLSRMLRSQQIRFVFTRLETYRLPVTSFQGLQDITELSSPGIINEYAGDFQMEDLRTTIIAAAHDLMLDLSPQQIEDIAKIALIGVSRDAGRYPANRLGDVALALAGELRKRVAIA